MIVGEGTTLDGERFADGLARAIQNIVQVFVGEGGQQGGCTGWLITPQLVLVPGFALRGGRTDGDVVGRDILVRFIGHGRSDAEDRAADGPDAVEMLTGTPIEGDPLPQELTLVRLRRTHPCAPLEFNLETPAKRKHVSLLAFPGLRKHVGLSFGKVLEVDAHSLAYDANTEPGSSGAPVFDEEWRVLGIHMMGDRDRRRNRALSRSAFLPLLQRSASWPEIAAQYRLADFTAGQLALAQERPASQGDPPVPALVEAALRQSVNPKRLSKSQREALQRHVVDPAAKAWTLQPAVRQSVIRAAGSLAALRAHAPSRPRAGVERVIGHVLAGAPYDLSEATDEELAWWIQAVRWFADVAPGLPTPADVNRTLQRRRVRSRLAVIASDDFLGRTRELAEMRAWFDGPPQVPLAISGVGGVGKSALVARFAQTLPKDLMLVWLDFDRADLAPDDAQSVIAEIAQQAAVQLEGLRPPPPVEGGDWKPAATALASELKAALSGRPAMVVLDSFEVAQYAERYQELWPVLETLCAEVPSLRVVVSGRAPQRNLTLNGHPAKGLPLVGLEPTDAKAWLRRHGIDRPAIVNAVAERSRGLPLILHLAQRLVEAGGRVDDLPRDLPAEIVAGFLYDRILDRLQTPALKELAMGALVLRWLTPEMIVPVLGGAVTLPDGDPSEAFRALCREAALGEGTETWQLRPEVRAAALELLDHHQHAMVRRIDEQAARWYETQDTNDPEIAAELVYHRLRLGDVNGAERAWRDGCGKFLQYAEESLKGNARAWLAQRLGTGDVGSSDVRVWEQEAAERIRTSRTRGLARNVGGILGERHERSADSALAFHEAYELRADGRPEEALVRLLDAEFRHRGPAPRDRALLGALLQAEAGNRDAADAHLSPWREPDAWTDRREGRMECAALHAARVHLTVDLDAEMQLNEHLTKGAAFIRWISPVDVLLPKVQRQLVAQGRDRLILLPLDGSVGRAQMLHIVEQRRIEGFDKREPVELGELRRSVSWGEAAEAHIPWLPRPAWSVLTGAWRRWSVMADRWLFEPMVRHFPMQLVSPLHRAVLDAQALFAATPGVMLTVGHTPLQDLVAELVQRNMPPSGLLLPAQYSLMSDGPESLEKDLAFREQALALFLSGPNPLELLVDGFAGRVHTEA